MLNIKDIVELAKAGYKPSDVKELITLTGQTGAPVTEKVTETVAETVTETVAETVTETVAETVTETVTEQSPEQMENQKLREQIAEMQLANTRKGLPVPERRSDEDVISDFVKSFM